MFPVHLLNYFIFPLDYVLLPFYLFGGAAFFNAYFKRKHGYNPELKKHFLRGLILKMVGCIAIGMIYEYYYRGAYDGLNYFRGGIMLSQYWINHPSEFFHVLFSNPNDFNAANLDGLNMKDLMIFSNESFEVCKVVGVFNLLCFNSFLPCSLFFCYFAYIALWNLFIFLHREFKLSYKLAAFCTIYIPSVLIWDSGIFKDTITFSALCWLFICAYYSFIKPKKLIYNLVGFAISGLVIGMIKLYILAAFIPFFILYLFNSYKARIKNGVVRTLATPFVLSISIGLTALLLRNANQLLGRFSLDQVLETATGTYRSITAYGGYAGSAYNLSIDFSSPSGLLIGIPEGINLTLFRPYPWEYAKPFILLASAESMIILYYTLFLLFKGGIGSSFRFIWKTPLAQFCLLFSFLFAFMTGISAANFGTLVRYKIPCLPFYILFLALLYQYKFPNAGKKLNRVSRYRRAHSA